jgi:hypothetical protein
VAPGAPGHTPARKSQSRGSERHLGLRGTTQQQGPGSQDLDKEAERCPSRSTAHGLGRKVQSTPNLAAFGNAQHGSQRERGSERNKHISERSIATTLVSPVEDVEEPKCERLEPGRQPTPGWAPPPSRGSLVSRGSLANRQSASRSGCGRGERERRRTNGLLIAGRQRLGPLASSLPAACFERERPTSQGVGKQASGSPSPSSSEEPRCSIDDETTVPQGLFEDLLRQAKEVKRRGQHYLDKKRPDRPHLVNMDQAPRCRSVQAELRPARGKSTHGPTNGVVLSPLCGKTTLCSSWPRGQALNRTKIGFEGFAS